MDLLSPIGGLVEATANGEPAPSLHHYPQPHSPPPNPPSCKMQPQSHCAPPSPPPTADHRKTPSILPAFYYEPNGVPVFKPTLEEFANFAVFMQAIDGHGKAAGLVKVIPPPEWTAKLPDITPALSTVKIRKPITQEISGGGLPPGAYFQANIEQRRAYSGENNLPACAAVRSQLTRPVLVQDWHDTCNSKAQKAPVLDSNGKLHFETEPNVRKRFRKKETSSSEKVEALSATAEPDQKKHKGSEIPAILMEGVEKAPEDASLRAEVSAEDTQALTLEKEGPSRIAETVVDPVTKSEHDDRMAMTDTADGDVSKHELASSETAIFMEADNVIKLEEESKEDAADAGELPRADDQCALPRKAPRKRAAPPKRTPISFDPSATSLGFTDEYCAELERFYWRNIAYAAPMYGADMLGSLFDADDIRNARESFQQIDSWNLAHLDNLLKRVKAKLPGVTIPYLYFGMWKATFAWHVEDMDLYSINYIHFGAPKQWYVVPPDVRDKFERIAGDTFVHEAEKCPEFLRHKTSILSPKYLASKGVNVNRVVQRAGEFMITFPYGYHQGFNFGFNCAESVNFALDSWVEIGKQAGHCKCVGDSVKLDVAGIFDPPKATESVNKHALGGHNDNGSMPGVEPGIERPGVGDGRPGGTLKLHIRKSHTIQSKQLDTELHKVPKQRKPKDPNAPKRIRRPKASTVEASGSHLKSGATTMTGVRISLVSRPATPTPIPQNTCVLCVDPHGPVLPTDKDKVFAHRQCAIFVPETRVLPNPSDPTTEMVTGIDLIERARWRLKCALCKPKSGSQKSVGACIQCARGKCVRAYHVSCAAKAEGVKMFANEEMPHCFCPQHDPEKLIAKWTDRDQWIQRANDTFKEGLAVWAKV
ncbi:hypothetical protein HDU86_003285 [Geranomyces michiganensis]|nr:hypothetical protein HDU86_003285 [Geranomyces michiganensis]